jgi:hypothetical protein
MYCANGLHSHGWVCRRYGVVGFGIQAWDISFPFFGVGNGGYQGVSIKGQSLFSAFLVSC